MSVRFSRSPAYVTLGEALSLAARYWADSLERWVLAVVAVAAVNGLASGLLGGVTLDSRTMASVLVPGAGGTAIDPAQLPRILSGPLAVAVVSLVAGWFLVANAVAGIRGREVTLRWVLGAGIRTLAAAMLLAAGLAVVLTVLVALRAIGLVLAVLLLPALVYIVLRLTFWGTSIFDGGTIDGGLARTWEITRGGVLRVLGWTVALAGLGLVVSIGGAVVAVLLGRLPAVGDTIVGALDAAFQAFSVVVMAILYESQRLRSLGQPVAPYPAAPYPAAPPEAAPPEPPPSDRDGPLAPPPPPPPPDPWR